MIATILAKPASAIASSATTDSCPPEVLNGLPFNTSGGQLSVGQAGAAGGHLGVVEGLRQLTGETLGARIDGARHGIVSGFGMVNFRRGLTSAAAILAEARN